MPSTPHRTLHPGPPWRKPAALVARVAAWLFGMYAWLLFSFALLGCGTLILLLRKPARTRPLARAGLRMVFRLAGMPLSASGLERLPSTQHVLMVNHASFLDGLALLALLPAHPGYAFVVRQQFRSQRLLCPLLRSLGTVVLTPTGAGSGAGNAALIRRALLHGVNLVIFPEAGFVAQPGLRRFHSGAFRVAMKHRVLLVPAGLHGTRKALPVHRWFPQRAAISLAIGSPLYPPGISPAAIADTMFRVRQAILPLTGEPDATRDRLRTKAPPIAAEPWRPA